MRERKADRHLMQQREYAERRLNGDGGRKRERVRQGAAAAQRPRDVERMQQCEQPQRIGRRCGG